MKLIIINGPAGVGKTTVAKKLHKEMPFSFLLDLDEQRNFISNWEERRRETGILSFDIALAIAEACFNRGVSFISGKTMLYKVEGGREKNVLDLFIDLGKKYQVEIFEIMLWADKQTVLKRANKRGYEIKTHLDPKKIEKEWEHMRIFKSKRPNSILIDTTNLEPDKVLKKIKEIVFK